MRFIKYWIYYWAFKAALLEGWMHFAYWIRSILPLEHKPQAISHLCGCGQC